MSRAPARIPHRTMIPRVSFRPARARRKPPPKAARYNGACHAAADKLRAAMELGLAVLAPDASSALSCAGAMLSAADAARKREFSRLLMLAAASILNAFAAPHDRFGSAAVIVITAVVRVLA